MSSVSEVQTEIEDRLKRHLDAVSRGDANGALQVFADDAIVRPANVEPIRGVAALREFFERTFAAMTVGAANFFTEELYLYESQAFQFGTYDFRVAHHGGDRDAQRGSFAIVWKRQRDGTWRYHRGIMNSSLPPMR